MPEQEEEDAKRCREETAAKKEAAKKIKEEGKSGCKEGIEEGAGKDSQATTTFTTSWHLHPNTAHVSP